MGSEDRKSYADYGMTEGRAKELLKECRNGNHANLVRQAAYETAPVIAEYLIMSICGGKSFDKIMMDCELGRIKMIWYCRTDFYAVRRQALAILDRMLNEGTYSRAETDTKDTWKADKIDTK